MISWFMAWTLWKKSLFSTFWYSNIDMENHICSKEHQLQAGDCPYPWSMFDDQMASVWEPLEVLARHGLLMTWSAWYEHTWACCVNRSGTNIFRISQILKYYIVAKYASQGHPHDKEDCTSQIYINKDSLDVIFNIIQYQGYKKHILPRMTGKLELLQPPIPISPLISLKDNGPVHDNTDIIHKGKVVLQHEEIVIDLFLEKSSPLIVRHR